MFKLLVLRLRLRSHGGVIRKSALFLLVIAMIGCGGGGSAGNHGGGGDLLPTLSLSVSPANPTIYSGVSFSVLVTATESGITATPTITLGSLPAGLSTSSVFPMSVPKSGATIGFTTSTSIAPGNYSVPISGTADSATASASIALQVSAGTPPVAYFARGLFNEVGLAQGASTTLQFQLLGSSDYNVALSLGGLPSGVSASINPQNIIPGDTFQLTLTASAGAAPAQNVELTLTGTPSANIASPSSTFLLDITPISNVGWSNQTSYVSTRATPFSAVYDPAHQLIYAANQVWNSIEIISDKTRTPVHSISVRDPRGMDLSLDGTRVWVATGSQVMYSIDTSTFKATRYQLPGVAKSIGDPSGSWEGAQVLSLADGTLLLIVSPITGDGSAYALLWDPTANKVTQLTLPAGLPTEWGVFARSGDGKRVFVLGGDENETSCVYDVLNKTFSTPIQLSSFGYASLVAANADGSRVAVADVNGLTLYDGSLNPIAPLFGDGGWGAFPAEELFPGGFVFSPDGSTLYEETESTAIPTIVTIDVATQQPVALAPAMPVIPTFSELSPSFYIPMPFAVDSNGMLLGIEYHGIAFDDSTAHMNYSLLDPGSPTFLQHMSVYAGPLSGGTTSGGFGNAFSLVPDVFYGAAKGTASLSSNSLSITSPPASASGPVDVKLLFPDGIEVFDPQFFTYGVQLQDAIISGGAPQGGVAAKLDGFGLPLDPSQDTVSIGGNKATVTSTVTQYPPFTGEQTDMFLSYTTPSGVPGWADLTVTTPNGSSTLPHSFFFAKSVTDYALSDTPTFALLDSKRNQLYLSAGNHIDVFSLSSFTFATPLSSPVSGSQFQGLSMTPDGSTLLAADLTNGAVAVIDPDAPSGAYEIGLPGSVSSYNQCSVGPLFVAADNQGNAWVTAGAVVGQPSCGPQGSPVFIANLSAKTSSKLSATSCGGGLTSATFVSAPDDGSFVAMSGGFRIYLPAQQTCIPVAGPAQEYAVTVSGDGNLLGLDRAFVDSSGYVIGRFAYPSVFYPQASSSAYYNYVPYQDGALQNPKLNGSGSLYYWAYPGYIDVVDVQHGKPALRFGLTETVSNSVSPMAIDSSGQHIYLITNRGLTIVDLGNAPLAIGHFSQTTASAGTQIVVRGSGFQSGITVSVGGTPATTLFTDSSTLTFTLPTVNSGLQDVTLSNPDGKTYNLQNALTIQ